MRGREVRRVCGQNRWHAWWGGWRDVAGRSARVRCRLVMAYLLLVHNRQRLRDYATKQRLPVEYAYRELVEPGGLMSFGPSYPGMHSRAAYFVDKILKGAKPADLPVERPTKFE